MMPPTLEEEMMMDQEAMMAEAEAEEAAAAKPEGATDETGAPSIVYEEFNPDAPDLSLLTETERAALDDDMSMADVYDDEADAGTEDLPIDDGVTSTDPEPVEPAAPVMPPAPAVDLTINYAARIAAIDAEIAGIKTQLSDGELGDADFATKLAELAESKGALRADEKLASAYLAEAAKVDAKQWKTACDTFKESFPALFAPEHMAGFDAIVNKVTADETYSKMPFSKQLEKAAIDYAFLKGDATLVRPAKAAEKDPAKPAADKPAAKPAAAPKAEKMKPVPTLARLPAAAKTPVDGSRYAALDAMVDARNVMATEQALSRMSKEQLEAYGAGL